MAKSAGALPYEPQRFPLPGAIDADGHICEPESLWRDYLEQKYKFRAIRIRKDEHGLEYLEADLRKCPHTAGGMVSMFHAVGDDDVAPSPDRTWTGNMPYGGGDPSQRLDLMDRENLEKALLYPTLSLCWEMMVTDPEITIAYQRAYNRWIADFCRDSGGRLVPIAQLSLLNVEGSVAELERAVKDGCRGAYVGMGAPTRKPHAHPDHDPIFRKCEELGVPFAIHPSYNPGDYILPRYNLDPWDVKNFFYSDTLFFQMLQQAFVGFFHYGTLEKFPKLQLGVLESGAGWMGSLLDRMDALFEHPFYRSSVMTMKPSDLFRRQCFVSGDPDEPSAIGAMQYLGPDSFLWATDYPHPDHTGSWVPELEEFAEQVDERTRDLVLGRNVTRIYALD